MAVNLNLVKADTTLSDVAQDKRQVKLVDILTENRQHYNSIVDALNLINTELANIKNLSEKVDQNEQKVDNLINVVVPNLHKKIEHQVSLMEAKLLERIEIIEKERLLENAHSRRRHLIVNGVEMKKYNRGESEPTEQIFRDLLVDKLKIDREYADKILFRDLHRLPPSNKFNGPPPIIAAFLCQRDRNYVMSHAKNLKNTKISIKSDLPRQLNQLRGHMLDHMKDLKVNHTVRLVERSYFPVLQRLNPTTERWETVMEFKHKDKDIPLDVALKPKLPAHLIRIIDVASADEAYVTPPRGRRGDNY